MAPTFWQHRASVKQHSAITFDANRSALAIWEPDISYPELFVTGRFVSGVS